MLSLLMGKPANKTSVCVRVRVYLRLMMKTAVDISSRIPTPLTDRSRKAELTPSPIRGKGSAGVRRRYQKWRPRLRPERSLLLHLPELVENSKGVLKSPYPAAVRARTWNTYTVRGVRPVTSAPREKVLMMR